MPGTAETIGDALLAVHRSYLSVIQNTMRIEGVHAYSHVTGGGIEGNTRRVVREPLTVDVDFSSWVGPAIFRFIKEAGNVPEDDMRRTFNLGIGLVIVVAPDALDALTAELAKLNEAAVVIGKVGRDEG